MLYERAVDLLASLADRPVPGTIGQGVSEMTVPPYDMATLLREAMLVPEWWMPAAGAQVPQALADDFRGLIAEAVAGVADSRRVMVLRDYHADNLLWLPERPGLAAVGLLDYQDVLAGHPAYDLVSLLEDARRDTTPDLRAAMIVRYLSHRPDEDADAFRQAYAVLGAQRNLKIVGIFARLAIRDRKPRYLAMIPRVWDHLRNDLSHPALAALRGWVDAHVPAPDPAVLQAIAARVTG
jgi:aminoglycoside/choline kinase family phosphotransferase